MGKNNEKPILAIDPGASGGFAWRTETGQIRTCCMPHGMTSIHAVLEGIMLENPGIVAIIEQVGAHFPGNRASASVAFGRHIGNLEALLYCLGIPMKNPVAPVTWMKPLRPLPVGMEPQQKLARKRAILEKVKRMFPSTQVTLKTADALGILAWYIGMDPPVVDWLE